MNEIMIDDDKDCCFYFISKCSQASGLYRNNLNWKKRKGRGYFVCCGDIHK